MMILSGKLASIGKDAGDALLEEAREIILRLRRANQRWNILELDEFLNRKQKELSVGYRRRPVYAA